LILKFTFNSLPSDFFNRRYLKKQIKKQKQTGGINPLLRDWEEPELPSLPTTSAISVIIKYILYINFIPNILEINIRLLYGEKRSGGLS